MMKAYMSESLLLLMGKKKYAEITIAEITEKAGVNRSTYYRNFTSKEDIIKFYLEQIMNDYLAEYETMENKSFEIYIRTIFHQFYKHKSTLLMIYQNNLSYLLLEVLNNTFKQRLSSKWEDKKNIYRIYYHIGGIYNFFMLWLSSGMEETPDALTRITVSMFSKDAKPVLYE